MPAGMPITIAVPLRPLVLALAVALTLGAGCRPAATSRPAKVAPDPTTMVGSLDALLTPYLGRYDLPALAAAVVQDGRVIAAGAVGTRRAGTTIPVTLDDRFHIGSDTKPMTALLVAMDVEAGKLRWDTTMGEAFPELAPTMSPGLRAVTVTQLLSHTSGLPGDDDDPAVDRLIDESSHAKGNLDALRYDLLKRWHRKPLHHPAGSRFDYSNLGFIFAGAIVERVGGRTWEELVQERIFDPMALRTAGFGPQSSYGKVDAPLGHDRVDGKLRGLLAGPNGDNPPLLGPAGTVHLSVMDFAAWASWQAGEGKRGPALASPESLRRMHTPIVSMAARPDAAVGTPAQGRYALGWGEIQLPFFPEPFVFHGGSNQLNLAYIMLLPRRDYGLVLVTNVGGDQADAGLKALVKELLERWPPPAA